MKTSMSQSKPISHYLVKGPQAVESRLRELEKESLSLKARVINISIIRTCLRELGLGRITPRVRTLLRTLGSRTLAEIRNEQLALQTILGRDVRIWEAK